MLLRGTGLLLHLLDGGFDQLAMALAVETLADDLAHGVGDEIGHLQANGLDRPLAFGVDIAPGCLDDPPRLLAGFLLRLLLNPFGGSVGSFDDSSRLLTRLLDRGRSLFQALLGLQSCLSLRLSSGALDGCIASKAVADSGADGTATKRNAGGDECAG